MINVVLNFYVSVHAINQNDDHLILIIFNTT